jgi:hypothetical protein
MTLPNDFETNPTGTQRVVTELDLELSRLRLEKKVLMMAFHCSNEALDSMVNIYEEAEL